MVAVKRILAGRLLVHGEGAGHICWAKQLCTAFMRRHSMYATVGVVELSRATVWNASKNVLLL